MKRHLMIAAIAALAPLAAGAQNMYDALRFSRNEYYGTARSMAMGNAMTALGGDMGSVTINPAGSAVNSYSQFTISPGVSAVYTGGSYCADPSFNDKFGPEQDNSKASFILPNYSANFYIDLHRNRGLKGISFGFTGMTTAVYTDNLAASGVNSVSSFMGALATEACGTDWRVLDAANYDGSAPFNQIVGWKSGMISTFGGDDLYIGSSEVADDIDNIYLGGPLTQRFGRMSTGSKNDLVLNIGFNIGDRIFVGGNLGITMLNYNTNTYFREIAENPNDFFIDYGADGSTYFTEMRYRSQLSTKGTGAYAKIGIIANPVAGLRLGAAIQTATGMTIKEKFMVAGDTWYKNSNFNASATSDEAEYKYRLRSPAIFNFGAAYTIGKIALVSMDYEICDYGKMMFREVGTNDHSYWQDENDCIKDYMGPTHSVRFGAEVRPIQKFSVRAGYNYSCASEFYYDENDSRRRANAPRNALSLGLGYQSNGTFFFDLAARYTMRSNEYTTMYSSYMDDVLAPEVCSRSRMLDVVATFGFRF